MICKKGRGKNVSYTMDNNIRKPIEPCSHRCGILGQI